MLSELKHRAVTGFDHLTAHEANVVLNAARTLQNAARTGAVKPLLRGLNIALLVESIEDRRGALVHRAATELGAHVAHVKPSSLARLANPAEVRHTAGMLGRLYDAIACEGLPAADVQRIRDDAGVPVYENVAADDHPTAALTDLLGSEEPPEDRRRRVLQAVLLTLA